MWGGTLSGSVSDLGAVTNWPDISGNSNDFGNGHAGSSAAVFYTSGTGGLGKPAVRFVSGAGGDWLSPASNFASAWTEGEMFVVTEVAADPPTDISRAGSHLDMGGGTFQSHHPWTSGDVFESFGNTSRPNAGNPSGSLADWHLYNARITSAGALTVEINGAAQFSTSGLTVSFSRAPVLGRGSVASPRNYDGSIALVVVFDRVLSGADRGAVESYVSTEYGITIS